MIRTRLPALGLLLLTLVASGAASGAAWAQPGPQAGTQGAAPPGVVLTGTLRTIKERGTILIGFREASIPFSYLNRARQPVGYSVDICRGIAADVAAALNAELLDADAPAWRQGVRTVFVPVAPDARLPKVIAGEVDLECGSTTATTERAKQVAFSPVLFLAGTRLMVPAGSGIASYRDLAGKSVAVSAGTTNGDVLRILARRVSPPITVVDAPDLAAAYDMLAAGQVAAFASDDILLAGQIATRPDGGKFRVVGDYLSFEPYAVTLRRDDPDFAALVRRSFERQAQDGALRALYNRWFTDKLPEGETLNLPMGPHLTEMFRSLGEPD